MPDPTEAVVIRIRGLTSEAFVTPLDGMWLVEYDPTRPGTGPGGQPMSAHIAVSPDRAQAREFPSAADAHAYWMLPSGRPAPADRPLTAYMIDVLRVDQDTDQDAGPTPAPTFDADACEQIFYHALGEGDAKAVEAALIVMAAQDPRRAARLYAALQTAVAIRDVRGTPTEEEPHEPRG